MISIRNSIVSQGEAYIILVIKKVVEITYS